MTRRRYCHTLLAVWCWALALSIVVALRAQDSWTGVERIVAVGDIHGDYGQLVRVLRSAAVIDRHNNWIAGKTHLVQLGDVVDRGPDSRKAMDLLVRLENQAQEQGGYVHALIGNHEAMNVYGDLHYVTKGEFAAFRNDGPGDAIEILYSQHIQELKRTTTLEKLPIFDDEYRRKWESRFPPGFFAHRFQFSPRGQYGKWIRGHDAVIRINDSIFLHGGIGPRYAAFSISQLNQGVQAELQDFTKLQGGMVMDPDGPLWYRGLALDEERSLARHVQTLLARHDAARIVIAHTVTEGTVIPRFGGRVLLIDVGLSGFYGSRLACLVIENGKPYTLHRGKPLEMPSDSGKDLLRYLKQAAALDPPSSPLAEGIAELEARLASAKVRR
jgi:hypothetical protein